MREWNLTNRARGFAAAAALLVLTGCASAPQKTEKSNATVEGANAIEQGPPRDRILWEYRTAVAEMRHGKFDLARQHLEDAHLRLVGVFGPDSEARKARGYFHAESKKTFIGEPYERSMAYIYLGLLYWMRGEPDNARACFRSAEFEDSDAENHTYAGDWVLADYLDGLITEKLGGDGSDALKRAQAATKKVLLPAYNHKANLHCFVEFGPGPNKYATGRYGEELRFAVPESPVATAEIRSDDLQAMLTPLDDVGFQAQTRGGRAMDHILANKAVFKSGTDIAGDVALAGGVGTVLLSNNGTGREIGAGIALAGLIAKGISAATKPEADVRAWDNLPRYLCFASFELSSGPHTITIIFRNGSGVELPGLTKRFTVNISSNKNTVLFISDQSVTPQNI